MFEMNGFEATVTLRDSDRERCLETGMDEALDQAEINAQFATASGLIHSLDCGYFRSIIFV